VTNALAYYDMELFYSNDPRVHCYITLLLIWIKLVCFWMETWRLSNWHLVE